MDTELLVDERIEDGRRLIAQLVKDGFDVSVAFWVLTGEDQLWYLYIGSASADAKDIGSAYRRVYASLARLSKACVTFSEIKLISLTNTIARDAIAVRDRYPGRMATRFHGKQLGNLPIEEAYVYPRAVGPMTRNEVLQTVVGLMNRTGPLQPSIVTLYSGGAIKAIPVGVDMKSPGAVNIVLHDVVAGQDRVVSADDVANIQ
ncbi:MAG: hypothetical protein HYS13_07120 [Planctomycetia bacterium]|nr:hypothetical protein [Planctomycetia bacterium]